MRLAEIKDEVVVNIIEAGIDPPEWATDWPEPGDDVGIGWSFVGGAFVPPPVAPGPLPEELLADAKTDGIARMLAWAGDFMARFTADTPADERLSWDAKEQAARAQVAGTADAQQVALLEAEATITGETVDNLALLILANAELFRAVVGRVSGLRRVTRDAIMAAQTPESVQAVLDAAQEQALAMAADLGIAL